MSPLALERHNNGDALEAWLEEEYTQRIEPNSYSKREQFQSTTQHFVESIEKEYAPSLKRFSFLDLIRQNKTKWKYTEWKYRQVPLHQRDVMWTNGCLQRPIYKTSTQAWNHRIPFK